VNACLPCAETFCHPTFNIDILKQMEIIFGTYQIKPELKAYIVRDKFDISENGHFMIDTIEVVNYVCSYG